MARLPVPGQDDGIWGNVLNDFLLTSLNGDGSIKPSQLPAATSTNMGAVQLAGDFDGTAVSPKVAGLQGVAVASGTPGDGQVLGYSATAGKWVAATITSSTVTDATTAGKGIVQLGGDLAGTGTTAAAPIVSDGAIATSKLADGAVTTAKIANGAVGTTQIASAAITASQIAGGTITDANISSTAAIAKSKLASLNIGDSDVNAISEGKITGLLADLSATEKTANKGQASGYAALNTSSIVPTAQLGTGTASTTTYLRGDSTWASVPSAPVTSVNTQTGAVSLGVGNLNDVNLSTPANNQVLTYNTTSGKWINQTPTSGTTNSKAIAFSLIFGA